MSSELKSMRLQDFVTLQRGHDLTESERKPGNIPVYGSFGMSGYHNAAKAKGPGVTVGRSGASFGVVNYCSVDFWPHNTALYVIDFHGNNEKFAYYYLKNLDFTRFNSGSAQASLNRNYIHPMEVKIPPLPTQHAIARILGSLDDKIELNRQMNETLEAMARAIFQSWFVDFGPVRAKAEGRQPAGMDVETAALFPSEFEDVDGREVPRGWEVKPLSSVIDLLGGGTPQTSVEEYWNGEIPWFSVVDAPSETDMFVIDTEKHIKQAGVENSSTNILPVRTTIITARGTVGKLALVGVPMAMNQSCYGIQGRQGYPAYFIHFIMKRAINELQQQTHGTVFETITRQTFDGVEIVIPPKDTAQKFDSVITSHLEKIRSNLMESRTLTQIRDALLPKLMSGEISVEGIEK
jgi:type I restriction enzyme, S subunit